LAAVVVEAHRRLNDSVDDFVKAMGMTGLSKSQVSRLLCEEIDDKVKAFLSRPLEGDRPYLWIDATYVKVRQSGRIVSIAVVVAVGVSDGRREAPGWRSAPPKPSHSGPSSCASLPGEIYAASSSSVMKASIRCQAACQLERLNGRSSAGPCRRNFAMLDRTRVGSSTLPVA
jgi:mutator family transposase